MQGIAQMYYEMFWRECGTKGLTTQDKVNALNKLSKLSLRMPYWALEENEEIAIASLSHEFCQVPTLKCEDCKAYKNGFCRQKLTLSEMFPQLIPANLCKTQGHMHLTHLTSLLLYTMHMEIFKEIKAMAEKGELTQEQIKQIGDF